MTSICKNTQDSPLLCISFAVLSDSQSIWEAIQCSELLSVAKFS